MVFEDDVAIHVLSPVERWLCRSKFVYRLILERTIRAFKPFIFHSLGCQRCAAEQLALAIARDTRQYGLGRSRFDRARPACCAWMGTVRLRSAPMNATFLPDTLQTTAA